MSDPACAYLISRYPSVTHTFVAGEVRALRAAGVRIETASVRQVPMTEVLSDLDRQELSRTRALVPASPWTLLSSHTQALLRNARAYVGTLFTALRMARAGGRARLWQLFYFAEAIMLWAWVRRHRIHHIHVHHANVSADVALLACRYANRAGAEPRWTWSLTIHGPTELFDVGSHKLTAKVSDASAVVCISDFARSQVAALADPADLEKVHTVRCGIDLRSFRPDPARRDRETAEVLCVAALSRRKGHAVLLEALTSALEAVPAARLTLVGGGPERDFLEIRAGELGIAHAVRFLGPVQHDRMAALYDGADVFCLPSFAEGVPIVLMEAMAMEIPVIATNVMGIPELVDDERNGLLVAPARADLLAGALVRLLADPALRRQMGRDGRRRVATDYDRTASAVSLQHVLEPFII